mmetsp:Transcript_1851/g.7735  ORF Transcript_1851/g.7735 Transcript_1851/m.7735 type:complete len:288 (+) Transcript_1851:2143-3006(+)
MYCSNLLVLICVSPQHTLGYLLVVTIILEAVLDVVAHERGVRVVPTRAHVEAAAGVQRRTQGIERRPRAVQAAPNRPGPVAGPGAKRRAAGDPTAPHPLAVSRRRRRLRLTGTANPSRANVRGPATSRRGSPRAALVSPSRRRLAPCGGEHRPEAVRTAPGLATAGVAHRVARRLRLDHRGVPARRRGGLGGCPRALTGFRRRRFALLVHRGFLLPDQRLGHVEVPRRPRLVPARLFDHRELADAHVVAGVQVQRALEVVPRLREPLRPPLHLAEPAQAHDAGGIGG